LQFDFNHIMDHIYKQAYPCKSIADSCVTQSNMTIVRYLSILNNKKSHRLMAFSSPA